MLPLMFLFLLSIFFCANSAGLRNDGKYQKDRASAAENQFGAPTHSSHPLRCEQGRSQSGFWWISGHYHPGNFDTPNGQTEHKRRESNRL